MCLYCECRPARRQDFNPVWFACASLSRPIDDGYGSTPCYLEDLNNFVLDQHSSVVHRDTFDSTRISRSRERILRLPASEEG